MPNPSTPCGRATPQMALRSVGGWPARRAGGLLAAVFFPLGYPFPYGPASEAVLHDQADSEGMAEAYCVGCPMGSNETAAGRTVAVAR
jgi:hypothetical protein